MELKYRSWKNCESAEELDKLLSKKLAVDPLLLQELQEILLVLGAGVKLDKIFMPKPQGVKSLGERMDSLVRQLTIDWSVNTLSIAITSGKAL